MRSPTPQQTYLFTDVRHIRCGDLQWFTPTAEQLPLVAPPAPQVDAHAAPSLLPSGVRLVAQPARKTERLAPGTPRGSRVIFEHGLYRSWYLAVEYPPGGDLGSYSTARPQSVAIGYSESSDGFSWSERARCPIAVIGFSGFDGFTVFMDPKGAPAERYKAVYMAAPAAEDRGRLWERYSRLHPRHRDVRMTEQHLSCIYGAVSPDGLHWQAIAEPLMAHHSDTDTSVYFDEWLDRYVMYTRLYPQDRRWIGRAEAEDFRRWGPVQPLIWPSLEGPLSDDIYTNGRSAYPGEPGYHLMFPMIYHRFTQTSEVRLFSSADGICWSEAPGGPVMAPGEPGEWDSEFIFAGKDLVPWGADRIAVPYYGTCFPHKYPRWPEVLAANRSGWAWWPKGRLCAVTADDEGEFFTFPIEPAGRELRINMRTGDAGEVRVGIVGIGGRDVADCDPLAGDHLAAPVHWRGRTDIGAPDGQPVTLHFRLRAAEVFGFEWE